MLCPLLVAASLAIPARQSYPRDVATADASVRQLSQEGGNYAEAEGYRAPPAKTDRRGDPNHA